MIIVTSIALVLMALYADVFAVPRLVAALPAYTDWRTLRRAYWVLCAMSALLVLHAVGLALTWAADGYPGMSWELLLVGLLVSFAWSVRPPKRLTLRIEGLRAMEHAVEDRPDWASKGGK
jgi:hypothetical protein